MLLSFKMIKRIESVKVEAQVVIRKISVGVQKMYENFLISQHDKRTKRIEFTILKRRQTLNEACDLANKIIDEAHDKVEKLTDEKIRLQDEKNELSSVLNPFKGNLGGK